MSEILNFWENLENLEIENFKINFSALFRPQIGLKMIPFEPPDVFTHIWSGLEKIWKPRKISKKIGTRLETLHNPGFLRNSWKNWIYRFFDMSAAPNPWIFSKKKKSKNFFFFFFFFKPGLFFFRKWTYCRDLPVSHEIFFPEIRPCQQKLDFSPTVGNLASSA